MMARISPAQPRTGLLPKSHIRTTGTRHWLFQCGTPKTLFRQTVPTGSACKPWTTEPRLRLWSMLKSSLLALALSSATASMPATPLPAATAIKLDGVFSEAIWEQVPAVSDFRQRAPKDGAAPTFATDAKVVD